MPGEPARQVFGQYNEVVYCCPNTDIWTLRDSNPGKRNTRWNERTIDKDDFRPAPDEQKDTDRNI